MARGAGRRGPRINYGRPHKSLAKPYPRTPAMAAGLSDHIWTCEEIAALIDSQAGMLAR